jgi:hypothetical protein
MSRRRLLVVPLALAIAAGSAMTFAQQATGVISGKASRQFAPRYSDYTVQVRNAATGKPVIAAPVERDGRFSFPALALNERYLIEIVQTGRNAPICTEGPIALVADKQTRKTDVTIECGKTPAILWLLAASAGTAAAVGLTNASPSR